MDNLNMSQAIKNDKLTKLTLERSLHRAIGAHQKGKIEEAEVLYRTVLKSQSTHPVANHNLGVIAVSANKAGLALPFFKTATEASPKVEQFWISYIDALLKDKKFEAAKQVLAKKQVTALLGKKIDVLQEELKTEILKNQNRTEILNHNNISINPSEHELDKLLKYYQNGRYLDAEKLALSLTKQFPKHQFGWKVLGATLKKLGRINESLVPSKKSMQLVPEDAEAHYNLGNTFKDLGRLQEATASYKQAITLKVDHSDSYMNLFDIFEKSNKLDEIISIIKSTKGKIFDKYSDFLFYEALVKFRQEDYVSSESLINKINLDALSENRKLDFLNLKANFYHHKKDFKAAFDTFKVMNELVKNSSEYKNQRADEYLEEKRKIVLQLKKLQEKSPYKSAIQTTQFQPTFMIGFPRSGTTLLDTILRTHSKIDVVEEKPMLFKLEQSLRCWPNIPIIEEINNASAEMGRFAYFEELKKYIELYKNPIVIDKLPLNIVRLPLINQIFPESKFILALRHPLDCILSCWMQNFELNSSMANMVELETIVDFYCTAMEILKLSQERYSLNIYKIRYEDLVCDFKGSVTNLLAFFDLKWEEELINYQKTALSRGIIKTPSYSQVVRPIYKTASYRWKNYEKYLNPFKRQLEPWLRYYDYLD
jgi:tetratricopeptide (TPR) repeat protein